MTLSQVNHSSNGDNLQHGSDVPDRGIDRPDRRPGVPMEMSPKPVEGSHWGEPEKQRRRITVLKRMEIRELTPVFGTAQPPRGLSGMMRRIAYATPEHFARRWLLLIMADRVDVLEGRFVRAAKWSPLVLPALVIGLGLTRRRRPWWRRILAA